MSDAAGTRVGESFAALRQVFRNPNVRRLQLAFAGSQTGVYAYSIGLAVYAYHHGGVAAVGVLTFVRLIVAAAIAPFAASIADRRRRERVMLGSDVLRVGTLAIATAAAALGWPAGVVYAVAVVTSVAGTVFRPAAAALLPTLAQTPEELTAANVSASTIDSVGSFVGPALGALVLALSTSSVVFALTMATFAWSALLVLRIKAPARSETVSAPEEEEHAGLLAGVKAIANEPRLRLLIGLYGAQTFVAGALSVLIVVTALRLLDLGSAGVGILEAACGVGSILGAGLMLALVPRNRLAGNLALGIVLWGAPLVLVGVVTNTGIAVLAWALVGIGNTLVDISAITLLQRTAPVAVAARVFGMLESVIVGGLAFGALVAPALVGLAGPRAALIATGALLPILAALTRRQLQQVDRGATIDPSLVGALRAVPFIAPLPLSTAELLASRLVPVTLDAGDVLFRRGDPGDRFYVLTQGELQIELPDQLKREAAPAYVGEIALLRDVPRTATVEAVGPCELLALEREDFLAAVVGHAGGRGVANDIVSARLGVAAGAA